MGITAGSAFAGPALAAQAVRTPSPGRRTRTATAVEASAAEANIDWRQFAGTEVKHIGGLHPITNTMAQMAPEFEELTGITVTVEETPFDVYTQKLAADIGSGAPQYDSFMGYYFLDWQYGPAGQLANLDDFINNPSLTDKEWLDLDDFSPGLVAAARWDGVPGHKPGTGPIYTFPTVVETYILSYRKDLFDKLGLTVPTTVEDLVPTAKAIFESEGIPGFACRGTADQAPITAVWMSLLPNYGGGDLDETMTSRIAEEASVNFSNLLVNDIVKPYGPEGWFNLNWDDLRHRFANGEYGMIYDADFFAILYEDPANSKIAGNVGYGPLGGPLGRKTSTFYFGNSIIANARNKEAAWLFSEWLMSKAAMKAFTVAYQNLIPTRVSTFSEPEVVEWVGSWGDGSWLETVRENLETNAVLEVTPSSQLIATATAWMVANQKIYQGEDAATVLTAAADEVNSILDRAGEREA
jgi:multiple sugar transport system substrate-binding protein